MMGSPNSELTLDCKPQSYSMLLKSFGDSNNTTTHQLEEYLSCLEQERLKIEAFKRELPLCIHLLSNAMEASRQQLQSYKATSGNQLGIKRPILEEFIPMKHSNSQGPLDQKNPPDSISDKATWMTSAQLWSQGPTTTELQSSKDLEMGFNPKLSLFNTDSNKRQQRIGGAFLPFTKETNTLNSDLALASDEQNNKGLKSSTESGLPSDNSAKVSMENTDQTNVSGAAATNTTTTCTTTTTSQTRRKQRRCWSPDLHRRFVNALQMLGGSQVATPKQIRELMKVDGLTNDEVKSHLQKYRLHTRKPGPSPQGPPGPQLVVLGGIWVPTEYHHGVPPPTIYTAQPTAAADSQVGPHYCPPAIPQEFYPHPPLPPQHHHQLQLYKASSQGQRSPESCGRKREKDRSESIEDGKSESSSGEESNDRKKQEADEQSNEAQIILKF